MNNYYKILVAIFFVLPIHAMELGSEKEEVQTESSMLLSLPDELLVPITNQVMGSITFEDLKEDKNFKNFSLVSKRTFNLCAQCKEDLYKIFEKEKSRDETLQMLIEFSYTDLLKEHLREGEAENIFQFDASKEKKFYTTLLGYAVSENKIYVAKLLLERGAKKVINTLDSYKYHSLHYAVRFESLPMVQLLLDYDADPDLALSYALRLKNKMNKFDDSSEDEPLAFESIYELLRTKSEENKEKKRA